MKKFIFIALAVIAASTVIAQDDPSSRTAEDPSSRIPTEPEILLPSVLLQIEDVSLETLEVALPPAEEILAPEITVPLPQADTSDLFDIAFEVPLLDGVNPDLPASTESSIFSNGTLGFGTMNHIIGAVSLFKLGEYPRFRFGFSHEGIDGYNFRDPGTSYFFTEDQIDGWLSLAVGAEGAAAGPEPQPGDLGIDLEALFFEREEGLQGQSNYYSVDQRQLRGYAGLSYRPEEIVQLGAEAEVRGTSRLQSVTNPADTAPRDEEILVEPGIGISVDVESVVVSADADYLLRVNPAGTQHGVDARVGFDAAFDIPLFLNGSIGVHWNTTNAFSVPFEIGMRGTIDDVFSVGATGGLDVTRTSLTDLWERIPLVAVPGTMPSERRWHVGASFDFQTPDQIFTARGGLDFEIVENAIVIGAWDPATDLFPTSVSEITSFRPSIDLEFAPSRVFSADLSWTGVFLDNRGFEPLSTIGLELGLRQENGDFGGNLRTAWDIYNVATIPQLSVGGFWKVSEGVEFQLDFEDVLSPIYDDGRLRFGTDAAAAPFVTPGFRAAIRALISL